MWSGWCADAPNSLASSSLAESNRMTSGQAIATLAKPTTMVYVGNLSSSVTWQNLKDFIGDPSAHVTIPGDGSGLSVGFALVEFRTPAAADTAVRVLHNLPLDGRPLFLRAEVDFLTHDEAEVTIRKEKLALKLQQMDKLTAWLETAPPLLESGWSEGTDSCWAPSEGIVHDRRSLAYCQLCARMETLISARLDASMIPTSYERTFGMR